jgi:hypothetical protein
MRPRPVLTSNAIGGAVTGLAGILAFLGYANTATDLSGEAQGIGAALAFLVPTLIHLVTGGVAQTMVTPLADPIAHDGTPLVKATTLAQVNAQLLQPNPVLAPVPAAAAAPVAVVVPVPGANLASAQPALDVGAPAAVDAETADVVSAIDPGANDATPLPPPEPAPPMGNLS